MTPLQEYQLAAGLDARVLVVVEVALTLCGVAKLSGLESRSKYLEGCQLHSRILSLQSVVVHEPFKPLHAGVVLFMVLVTTAAGAESMKVFGEAIPRQVLDWKAEGEDELFDRKSIFGYIDGGAELYLAYGFRKLLVRRFTGPGGREIILDLFDMGSSEDAFGVFTTECDHDPIGIGQGSEYGDGLLRFWKGRHFVSIVALGKEPIPKAIILKLGKIVAAAIPSGGAKPNLLMYLPSQDRDPRRIRYFHTHMLLTKHYYVADENILLLNDKTDCLLVEYPGKTQESAYLLLVQYENIPRARQAYQRFLKGYMPDAKEQGVAKTENKRWTWARIDQDRIQIAFDAPSKERAWELLSSVKLRKGKE